MPIANRIAPESLDEYSSIRVKNHKADLINDILALSTGLDMAINMIKPGEITKKARKALTDLVASSYGLFAYRIAHNILHENGCIEKEAISDLSYRFDLPDDTHDDLVIYYKKN